MHTHEWEIKELPTSSYTGGEYLSIIIKNVIPYSSDYPLLYIPRYGNQVAFMAYISTLMGISVPCELCLTYLAVSCIPFMAYISTLMGISVPCLTYLAVSCVPRVAFRSASSE